MFIQIDDEPIYTVNGRHVISEIVTLCGGRNVFEELPQLAPPITAEAVLAEDPEVILSTDDTLRDPFAEWQRWPRMQAVRARTIYPLPSDLVTRASPRLAQGRGRDLPGARTRQDQPGASRALAPLPEHFAAVFVTGQHPRNHEQQVREPVQVLRHLGATSSARDSSQTRRSARRVTVRAR